MKAAIATLTAVALALAPGCATILRDDVERVTIETEPQGAVVAVDGVVQGRSPLRLSFQRDASQPVVGVWLEGHEAQYLQLARVMDVEGIGYLVMDLLLVPLLTGTIGLWVAIGVDLGGENFYAFEQDHHFFDLQEAAGATPPAWATRKVGELPPELVGGGPRQVRQQPFR